MLRNLRTSFVLLSIIFTVHTYSQPQLVFEFLPGYAQTLVTPLSIYQNGKQLERLNANYDVIPFESPIYYSYRLGIETHHNGWELEMNHLKIYLQNTTPIIQRFSVSHGYNQIWLNRTWLKPFALVRLGVGTVVSHDENTVNNQRLEESGGLFDGGYHFSGVSSQFALQKRYWFGTHVFLSVESKVSVAYARIRVVDGYAHTPVVAFHVLIGMGGAINL